MTTSSRRSFRAALSALVSLSLCTGCTPESEPEPPLPARWVQLSTGPCAIDVNGLTQCWSSEEWPPESRKEGTYVLEPGSAILGHTQILWEHRPDGTLRTVFCIDRGCQDPPGRYASFAGWAGISPDGALIALSEYPSRFDVDIDSVQWLAITTAGLPTALDSRFRLHRITFTGQDPMVQLSFTAFPIDVASVYYDGELTSCVLDMAGGLTCVGGGPSTQPFGEGPWRLLRAVNGVLCAQRVEDDLVMCTDGSTYDWGPLVDLDLHVGFELNVCGITAENEIRCEGDDYPPDLLTKLDAVNAERRIPRVDEP